MSWLDANLQRSKLAGDKLRNASETRQAATNTLLGQMNNIAGMGFDWAKMKSGQEHDVNLLKQQEEAQARSYDPNYGNSSVGESMDPTQLSDPSAKTYKEPGFIDQLMGKKQQQTSGINPGYMLEYEKKLNDQKAQINIEEAVKKTEDSINANPLQSGESWNSRFMRVNYGYEPVGWGTDPNKKYENPFDAFKASLDYFKTNNGDLFITDEAGNLKTIKPKYRDKLINQITDESYSEPKVREYFGGKKEKIKQAVTQWLDNQIEEEKDQAKGVATKTPIILLAKPVKAKNWDVALPFSGNPAYLPESMRKKAEEQNVIKNKLNKLRHNIEKIQGLTHDQIIMDRMNNNVRYLNKQKGQWFADNPDYIDNLLADTIQILSQFYRR